MIKTNRICHSLAFLLDGSVLVSTVFCVTSFAMSTLKNVITSNGGLNLWLYLHINIFFGINYNKRIVMLKFKKAGSSAYSIVPVKM